MKRLLLVFLVFLLVSYIVNAEDKRLNDPNNMPLDKWDVAVKDPGDPNELVQAKWNAVVNVLKDSQLDTNTKAAFVDRMISPVFDFELMGKLALGRAHWPKLNAEQRKEFTSLFVQRLKTSYREKIMLYENQQAEFQPAVPSKETFQVPMILTNGDKKTALLYKLRKADKSWKIYDVEIEGVSILLTYKSQFEDILRRGTVDDLLSQLKKPQDAAASEKTAS